VRRDGSTVELEAKIEAKPEGASLEGLRPSRGGEPEPQPRPSLPFRLPFGLDVPGAPAPEIAPAPETGARLGVSARPTEGGVEIVEVREGSLAQTLGLRPGDVLREIDGKPLADPSDVSAALAGAGASLEIRFQRDGAAHVVTLDH
jgi:membrane-associated protease RseP (regulator of RpoE activity)